MEPTPLALLAILGCGLAFSGLDLQRKRLTRAIRPSPLLAFLALGQCPLFLVWWVVDEGAAAPGTGYAALATASVLFNIVANLTMLESIRISPLSVTIPLLSLAPVFTTVLAIPLLGQVPQPRQWVGVVVVVIGAFLLVPLRSTGGRGLDRGSLLMIVTAFLWSLALPFDRLAMDVSSPSLHGLVLSLGVGLGVIVRLALKGRASELRGLSGHGRGVLLAIAFGAVALALQLIAMTLTWVSLIETAKRAIGNFMSVLLGRIFFGEGIDGRKLVAVAVMAAGVALVLW
jgi:drug/metabolite transporter (DMT)-like permease